MSLQLHVHLLPALIEDDLLRDSTAVIIDILRASSTMTTALHNGASRVIPCGTPEEAFLIRDQNEAGTVVLGGERGGLKIAGFDFGNSPAEYDSDSVRGRTVAFTTTNGTKALLKALQAREILVGAFLNRQAIIDRLARDQRVSHLICAGTNGVITGEDVLFAGAVVDGLMRRSFANLRSGCSWSLNDCAEIARGFWRQSVGDTVDAVSSHNDQVFSVNIEATMKRSRGGRNLLSLGYDSDISLCSQLDTTRLIPEFHRDQQCLLAAE